METTAADCDAHAFKCTPLISVKCCYGRFLILLCACSEQKPPNPVVYQLLFMTCLRWREGRGGFLKEIWWIRKRKGKKIEVLKTGTSTRPIFLYTADVVLRYTHFVGSRSMGFHLLVGSSTRYDGKRLRCVMWRIQPPGQDAVWVGFVARHSHIFCLLMLHPPSFDFFNVGFI